MRELDVEKTNFLINLKQRAEKTKSPYNAMILGMWTETLLRPKTAKSPFPSNDPLGFWFVNGFYASKDARIMVNSTK